MKYQTLTAHTDIRNTFDLHCSLVALFSFLPLSLSLSLSSSLPFPFSLLLLTDLAGVEKPRHKAETDVVVAREGAAMEQGLS